MEAPLYLRPRVESPLVALLTDRPFLHSLVDVLGSPLDVLLPEAVAENTAGFRAVYRRHHLTGRVYFAHKAIPSSALLRRLAAEDPAAVALASPSDISRARTGREATDSRGSGRAARNVARQMTPGSGCGEAARASCSSPAGMGDEEGAGAVFAAPRAGTARCIVGSSASRPSAGAAAAALPAGQRCR